MSITLGTSDPVNGLSSLPSIDHPIDPLCDHAMPNGDIKLRPIDLYKPPPRTLKVQAQPFCGLQERGLPMHRPVGATFLDSGHAFFKVPDMLTELYVSEKLPVGKEPPALYNAFNKEQRAGVR